MAGRAWVYGFAFREYMVVDGMLLEGLVMLYEVSDKCILLLLG